MIKEIEKSIETLLKTRLSICVSQQKAHPNKRYLESIRQEVAAGYNSPTRRTFISLK